jgi:hypothetical protein
MSFKTTLVLLLLAAAVAGFYFWVEKDIPTTEDALRASKLVFRDLKADDVVRIRIARPASPTADVLATREGGGPWRLEKPVAAEADAGAFETLLTSAGNAQRKDLIEDYDPASIGLDAPRVRVSFGLRGGAERTIAFGKEDASGRFVYAAVEGQKGALVLPKYVENNLVKEAFDLRDRSLFKSDRWLVDRFVLEGPHAELRFKKDGDFWVLEGPGADFADKEKVEGLLAALGRLQAKRFVDEAPADLAPYGLATPLAKVTIEARGVTETAELGARVPGSGGAAGVKAEIFARRGKNGPVMAVEDEVSDRIVWNLDAWRSKALLHLGRERIEALEVRLFGTPERVVRLARGAAWRFESPVTATADATATDDLVSAIEKLEIVKIAASAPQDLSNFGLDKPAKVVLETPKNKHAFLLGRAAAREDSYYVQREGKEAVYEVSFPLAKTLLNAWPVLRDRHIVAVPLSDVVRLDIEKTGAEGRTYVRSPEGSWSAPKGAIDSEAVDEIAGRLAALEAAKVLAPPDNPAALGLEAPWLRVRASLKPRTEGTPPQSVLLELGKATADRERNARVVKDGGETIWITIPEETVNVLERDVPPKPVAEGGGGAPARSPEPVTETAR